MSDKLLRNTTIYALGDIIPKALSIIVFPILTQYLTPADYGIVNYVTTLNLLLTIIGFLCLNTYYLVFYYRMENVVEQQKLLGNLSIFVLGINAVLTIILFLLGNYFLQLIGSKISFYPYIAIGLITNFFNLLTILPSALYRVQERPLPLTVLNVLKGLVTMALTVLLVVYFKYTALGVLMSTLIVSVVFGIIFLRVTLKNMIWNIDWTQLKQALIFSLPLLPGSLAYYLLSMADRLFIEYYLDLTQLGIYSTASTLALILNIVSYGAYKAFEPYFFKIYETNQFYCQFIKVQNVFFLVILFCAMGISMFAKEFFILFASEAYRDVYYFVPMLEIGVVFSALIMLYNTILTAREKTKTISVITIIGGVISFLINLFCLPILGITGACLASGVAFGVILICSAYYAKLSINFTPLIVSFLIAGICVWSTVYIFQFSNILLSLFFKVAIFLTGIVLICVTLKLNPFEFLIYSTKK